MGIHGIFKEIGQGERVSLAKFSSDHLVAHNRPLRIAIDISIWLFQIQAGKGGSNPALRTFYYRLLRLLSLNIHPLFVFDGPNKPLFKRNKKVGGPGVRVASVPEFLAKQLLKQFGFPWHVAPGEAEAECALLQREALVDAVLSEDVDTLMFGSGVTLRNWSAENTSKTPTHVNVYKAQVTKTKSGMDREGMILVALMSGGDYITEGIPGCGPKFACDAARAGYGRELVALGKKDAVGLKAWRDRLQHQIRTNEDKIFSRRNTKLTIPDDFPNQEVLGYYTQPCVSTAEKLAKLRESLKWDQEIDFAALRGFAADAFDWRCLGGAKKFVRNLAPAMLVREMRLSSNDNIRSSQEAREEREKQYISAIHGKRNHNTVDGELEYRISFIPVNLVPIDLSIEDEDDDFIPAGGVQDQSDAESDFVTLASSTADEDAPPSPSKKRTMKPYHPDQPEKLWIVHSFVKIGCPLLVEDYEAGLKDPKALLKQRRKERAVTTTNIHSKKPTRKKKANDTQQIPISAFATVVKSSQESCSEPSQSQRDHEPLAAISTGSNTTRGKTKVTPAGGAGTVAPKASGFRLPPTQLDSDLQRQIDEASDDNEETPKATRQASISSTNVRPFTAFAIKKARQATPQKTPRKSKRPSSDVESPALSQRSLCSYFSPASKAAIDHSSDIINLVSSSPVKPASRREQSPTPANRRQQFIRDLQSGSHSFSWSPGKLPESVTKRRKKVPLKRHQTAPIIGTDQVDLDLPSPTLGPLAEHLVGDHAIEAIDLASPSTARRDTTVSDMSRHVAAIPALSFKQPPQDPSALLNGADALDIPHSSTHPATAKPSGSKAPVFRPSSSHVQALPRRRSPRQQSVKKLIRIRKSVKGAWQEVEAEEVDLSGDGSGWKESNGRAKLPSWRKSGVEILDLTGV